MLKKQKGDFGTAHFFSSLELHEVYNQVAS